MEMLQESNVSWPVLSAVAVMNGPGSYTGLRIGLASAKGFCFARNTPLVLINQFDLMNYCNHSRAGKRAYFLKARENEYFYTAYASAAEICTEVIVIDTASLHAESGSADTPLFTSDKSLTDLSSDIEHIKILDTDIQRFVLGRFAEGRFADLMSCEPFYLKNVYINKINKL